MPTKCRVGVCGFDPMLVRGYVKTGFRALWWHIPDEVYEEYQVQPGDTVSGTLLAIYDGDAQQIAAPNDNFEWEASKESGLAILLPPEIITKYKLTAFHFLELSIDKVRGEEVHPGQDKMSAKWWPEEKMELAYKVDYIE